MDINQLELEALVSELLQEPMLEWELWAAMEGAKLYE
jgi:hypothetical protein